MKLSPRLKAIADWIEINQIVGDVGSDHGYLMTYLIENNIIKTGIASDINEGPVENCQNTVASSGYQSQIDIRLGGGLQPYKPNEIETVVIAGMGGELIRDILIESDSVARTIKTFLLQPMTGQDVLRKWLFNNHYIISKEKVVWEDSRCYEILYVVKGKMNLQASSEIKGLLIKDNLYEEIGFNMIYDDAYVLYLDKKINKYKHIMDSILKNSDLNQPKYQEAELKMTLLNEVKACIQTLIK